MPRYTIATRHSEGLAPCRKSVLCGCVFTATGIVMLFIRVMLMGTDVLAIQYTSNFLSFMCAITLLTQLRVPLLNAIIMTSFPTSILMAVIDIYSIFTRDLGVWYFLWGATTHIPVAVLGIIIFTQRYDLTNVVFTSLAAVVVSAWLLFVDPRVIITLFSFATDSEISILILWTGLYIIPFAFMIYDLYRRGAVFGSATEPLCGIECNLGR